MKSHQALCGQTHGPSVYKCAGPGSPYIASATSRRQFIARSGLFGVAAFAPFGPAAAAPAPEFIIDIHQHVNYAGRPDDLLLAHQRAMGIAKTILLPAGRRWNSPATHNGLGNGLEAKCGVNDDCRRLAQAHPGRFYFGANDVPDAPEALEEIERFLRLGGLVIGEQKFGLQCDAPAMHRLYDLAAGYRVPILMHWQYGRYNQGFDRFYRVLEQHPKTIFLGHAQTWWANIDKDYADPTVLYPKGKVRPGGLTDRYLSDYANMFGDLSAGSGLNALTRDEDHARDFLRRHQDKLVYGSDCNDHVGTGPACQGAQTLVALHRLAPTSAILAKLLHRNAERLFRF
jgi:predicted TIM-barrel fold metal-dependent hydrolase